MCVYVLLYQKTLSIDNWFGSEDSESPHRSCGCVISELVLRHPLFPGRGSLTCCRRRRSPGSPAEPGSGGKKTWGKWFSGIPLNKLGLHGQKWWNIDENSGFFCGFCSTKKVFHEQNHGVWIGVRQKQTHIFAAKLFPGKNNTGISLNSSHSHGLVPLLHPEKVVVRRTYSLDFQIVHSVFECRKRNHWPKSWQCLIILFISRCVSWKCGLISIYHNQPLRTQLANCKTPNFPLHQFHIWCWSQVTPYPLTI